MTYELATIEDLQAVYDVVQHTIKTIYPKYYPSAALYEKLGFSTIKHEKNQVENGVILAYEIMEKELQKVSTDVKYDGRKFVPKMNSENGEV